MSKFLGFSNKVISFSKGKFAIFFLVVFLVFSATILPDQSAKAEEYSGSAGSPDLSLFYSPDDLYQMAEQFGADGRKAYIKARFTFDLAFPFVYGAFLLTTNAWLLGKLFPPESKWRQIALLPIAAIILDLLENTSASIVIGRYPAHSPTASFIAPVFTFLKWLFVGGSFLAPILLLGLLLFKRLNK